MFFCVYVNHAMIMFSGEQKDVPKVSKQDVGTSTGKMLHVKKFAIGLTIISN